MGEGKEIAEVVFGLLMLGGMWFSSLEITRMIRLNLTSLRSTDDLTAVPPPPPLQ